MFENEKSTNVFRFEQSGGGGGGGGGQIVSVFLCLKIDIFICTTIHRSQSLV